MHYDKLTKSYYFTNQFRLERKNFLYLPATTNINMNIFRPPISLVQIIVFLIRLISAQSLASNAVLKKPYRA
jgi:hypothetical protein